MSDANLLRKPRNRFTSGWLEERDRAGKIVVSSGRVPSYEVTFASDFGNRLRDTKRIRKAQNAEEYAVLTRPTARSIVAQVVGLHRAGLDTPFDPIVDYVVSLIKVCLYAICAALSVIVLVNLISHRSYLYVFPTGLALVGSVVLGVVTFGIHFRKHRLMLQGWPRA